ncbi:c-type cytochrome [Shewanella cyperi]|uniref:C-type cytochrome n=1 Tax=Shewanella cyperi TaxID=2814292 RepID=A0A974XLA0_9GAMM|nr:c(7)-type cytochrome triheme domain-containing protein [Shewanella cyperi]QSX30490.1 c-type cytochrome [Shewanella cyperi]
MNAFSKVIAVSVAMLSSAATLALDLKQGEALVNERCSACHKPGVMGAPKMGNKADWEPRAAQGYKTLLEHGMKGLNGMPPKGGAVDVSDEVFESAVTFLLQSAGVLEQAKSGKAAPAAAKKADPKPAAPAKQETAVTAKAMQSAEGKQKVKPALKFNRLMKSAEEWNPPPYEDGIHDPEGEGAYALQPPKELFESLPKAPSGNRVDWVKALEGGAITPRYDRTDPSKQPFVMDLNIVREVKGFMPDVVYPHKQHTEWLDCSNCHPDIFIPKKGANQISMAAILMGEKCGVCHGKVAFPVSECRKCHSKNKTQPVGIKQ